MYLNKYSEPTQIPHFISQNYLMIDLRTKEDSSHSPLPSFVNIPYSKLNQYIPRFKKEIPIVVCCYYGHLSEYAYQDLTSKGFMVTIIKGGYDAYKHPVNLIYF